MDEFYVKCSSNEQAHALRPYLVNEGFLDRKDWNDDKMCLAKEMICVGIYTDTNEFGIFDEQIMKLMNNTLICTLPKDADLERYSKIIKQLFL